MSWSLPPFKLPPWFDSRYHRGQMWGKGSWNSCISTCRSEPEWEGVGGSGREWARKSTGEWQAHPFVIVSSTYDVETLYFKPTRVTTLTVCSSTFVATDFNLLFIHPLKSEVDGCQLNQTRFSPHHLVCNPTSTGVSIRPPYKWCNMLVMVHQRSESKVKEIQ